jgi:hypothetical protein
LRYFNDTRRFLDFAESTQALKGIVQASARPVPSIPSSYPTRSASLIRSGETPFQVTRQCAEQAIAILDVSSSLAHFRQEM